MHAAAMAAQQQVARLQASMPLLELTLLRLLAAACAGVCLLATCQEA
jgi:hypothetical protein